MTSFHPLIAYVYDEGLARFAVHKYDDSNRRDYDNVNAHLTNYSLNKSSQDFVKYVRVCLFLFIHSTSYFVAIA